MGIELSMFAALCLLLVFIAITTRDMFSFKEEQEDTKELIKAQGDKYFLEYGDHIYGSDIVEFIIKYDATYDYYITLVNGTTFNLTKEFARHLWSTGENGNEIWTQEYLTNEVLGNDIYEEFDVTYITQSDNSIDYYIYEK